MLIILIQKFAADLPQTLWPQSQSTIWQAGMAKTFRDLYMSITWRINLQLFVYVLRNISQQSLKLRQNKYIMIYACCMNIN